MPFTRMSIIPKPNCTKSAIWGHRLACQGRAIPTVRSDYIDLNFPTHPPFFYIFHLPLFIGKFRMHWVGKHIPRGDAKWVGSLLARLTPEQIRDAFRAAGYSQEQVEGYTSAVQARIAQ